MTSSHIFIFSSFIFIKKFRWTSRTRNSAIFGTNKTQNRKKFKNRKNEILLTRHCTLKTGQRQKSETSFQKSSFSNFLIQLKNNFKNPILSKNKLCFYSCFAIFVSIKKIIITYNFCNSIIVADQQLTERKDTQWLLIIAVQCFC